MTLLEYIKRDFCHRQAKRAAEKALNSKKLEFGEKLSEQKTSRHKKLKRQKNQAF